MGNPGILVAGFVWRHRHFKTVGLSGFFVQLFCFTVVKISATCGGYEGISSQILID